MNTLRGFAVFLAVVLPLEPARGQPSAPTDVAEQLGRLGLKNDKASRLQALRWIQANGRGKSAAHAIPALERCLREDPVGEVRAEAALVLCHVLKGLDKPCPVSILEALLDKEDLVRWQVMACMPFFKTFAPGSVAVLLRGVKAEKAEVRSDCLLILGRAADGDRRALEAMDHARRDKVFDVRHSAYLALFRAKDRLEGYVPYLIRLRDDPASVLAPIPEDPEVAKQERTQRNLFVLGSGVQLIEWSETRADELAAVLMKLLTDESAMQRRGSATLIGATAVKVELPAKREGFPVGLPLTAEKDSVWRSLIPEADPKAKKEPPPRPRPEKSKVALCLEKRKVEQSLRKLQETDPDRSVRDAARAALEKLATLNKN